MVGWVEQPGLLLYANKPGSNPVLGCGTGEGNPILSCGLRSNPILGCGPGGGSPFLSYGLRGQYIFRVVVMWQSRLRDVGSVCMHFMYIVVCGNLGELTNFGL